MQSSMPCKSPCDLASIGLPMETTSGTVPGPDGARGRYVRRTPFFSS